MERIVKYRLAEFFKDGPNPLEPDKTIRFKVQAVHGQKISTEESGDDPNTIYGISEAEITRAELATGGSPFFSDEEIAAMVGGMTDSVGGYGDTATSPAFPGIGRDPGATVDQPHPLLFEELAPWQIAEYIRQEEPDPETLIHIVEQSSNPEVMGDKILAADADAAGGEAREEVVLGVAELLGRGAGRGPEEHEGVPGTELPDGTWEGSKGTTGDEPEPPTDAAVALAKEHGIDLAKVTGTGSKGRVIQSDVQGYLDAQSSEEEAPEEPNQE